MKEKRKFVYFSFLILLLLLGWLYFYFLPIQTEIVKMESDDKLLNAKIKSATQFKEKIPMLKNQVVKLKEDIQRTESKILDESSLVNLVTMLEEGMQKYNIKIRTVSPVLSSSKNDVQPASNTFQKLFVEITLNSRFMNFAKFLENLDEFSLFLNPKGIMITHNETSDDYLTINLFAEILFKPGINK